MFTFQVNDMTCGHCASTISRAIATVDKAARLDIRIQQKLVRVTSTASAAELAEAIQDAGYTPQLVQAEQDQPGAAKTSSGCGCGCGPSPKAVNAAEPSLPVRNSCCS